MPRKTRPLNRESGVERDASLIVIASEDRYAVKDYFDRFKTKKVQVHVIPTEDCNSAPDHVLSRLKHFEQDNPIEPGDQFWLCIDRDKWDDVGLIRVLKECKKNAYEIALSNPCFELWVLLHFEAAEPKTCKEAEEGLRQLFGGYGKQCCQTIAITKERIEAAIDRARALDKGEDWLPDAPVTRVYKILDAILKKDLFIFD